MAAMNTTPLKIDFVSDVSCPWCAVGLGALEEALQKLQGDVSAELHFQPFELNPKMGPEGRGRIWNTFDAHRLLHWAGEEGAPGQQHALKKALMAACHTRSEAMGHHDVLLGCVHEAGLNEARAQAILASDEYAQDVREREAFYTSHGIHSVPAVIINDKHLISGGQPAAVFEQALRQIAAE